MRYERMKLKSNGLLFKRSFTMVELIVVMIVMSIIASFAVPGFTKATTVAKARDAMHNIVIIHAAQSLYRSNYGFYIDAADVDEVNDRLSLNISVSDATSYACIPAGVNVCTATASTGANTFKVTGILTDPVGATNPSCATSTANCP